jgi:hypothetical membrane protein
MKRFRLSFISGILACAFYLIFTLLAYLRYPLPYSPTDNWLSDLGNPVLNPDGAQVYNIGIILTAILMMLFFLGLGIWEIDNHKVQRVMLRLTQGFGIAGCLAMLLSAIYSIDQFTIHAFWSTSLYILLSTAFIFSAAMLRYHPGVPRWLLVLGILTAVLVLMSSFFQQIYLLEWITVILFMGYILLLALSSQNAGRAMSG